MYATDGQMDGRTDKSNAYFPLPYGRGITSSLSRCSDKLSSPYGKLFTDLHLVVR